LGIEKAILAKDVKKSFTSEFEIKFSPKDSIMLVYFNLRRKMIN
jgi:hypothetical protein